jgi:uncharacterized protein
MTLRETIQQNTITAMKAKDAARLETLRMLAAAIQTREIADRTKKLTDDDILAIVKSEVKKRSDAAEDYTKGGRPELAEKERAEITILEGYLPAQLSDEAIGTYVAEAIAETGASSAQQFGDVMKALMPKIAGRADGKRVSAVVKQTLAP